MYSGSEGDTCNHHFLPCLGEVRGGWTGPVMPAIFAPTGEKDFFTPFGPMLGYVRMPDALVDQLNGAMTEQLADHPRKEICEAALHPPYR